MKMSSMLVISVTTNLQHKVILNHTLSQNMKVLSMLVISVTTKLHGKVKLLDTLIENIFREGLKNKKCLTLF